MRHSCSGQGGPRPQVSGPRRLLDGPAGSAHMPGGFSRQIKTMAKSPPRDQSRFGTRTQLVHAGRAPWEQHGFVNTPIYRGSTVLYPTMDDIKHRRGRFSYGTKGTPTTDALETAWTALVGGAGTVLTPSGLAAVTIRLLGRPEAGGPLLLTGFLYPPTPRVFGT